MTLILPPLPDRWEPTRQTLHEHALRLRALARAFAAPHPRFWHVGLTITEGGLRSAPMLLPGGGMWTGRLDLQRHVLAIDVGEREHAAIEVGTGSSATQLDAHLRDVLADLGIDATRSLAVDGLGEPGEYDADAAAAFWGILGDVAAVFETRRRVLSGDVGPTHVWPHGFDASFEWYPPASMAKGGAQLNVGFYPAEPAYFYSNPYPFDETLLTVPLPHGATWHTEDWEGSILPYEVLVGDRDAGRKLLDYLEAVATAAEPTLTGRGTEEEVGR